VHESGSPWTNTDPRPCVARTVFELSPRLGNSSRQRSSATVCQVAKAATWHRPQHGTGRRLQSGTGRNVAQAARWHNLKNGKGHTVYRPRPHSHASCEGVSDLARLGGGPSGGTGCRPTLRGTRSTGGEGGGGGSGLDQFAPAGAIISGTLAELAELAEPRANAGGIIGSVLFKRRGPPGGVIGPGLPTSQVSPSPVEPNVDDHATP